MKRNIFSKNLITSIFITMLLIYFMMKTTSPKIIFIPFVICSVSMAGKSIALLLDKQKYATLFGKLFVVGFLLFWFGFLIVACYLSVRDKNYSLMVFSLPFWFVGIYLIKNKLLKIKPQNKAKSKFSFMMIISAALVIIAFISGLIISALGIMRLDAAMIFAGAFFTFGSFTFILVALTALGYFDKLKIDVLGMYVGVLFVAIGIGFIAIKYETIETFGFWILIPILLVSAGVFQIVKCLKNGK